MWSSFTDWFHAPFKNNMTFLDVALSTLLVIVLVGFWLMILSHLRATLQ